MGIIQGGKYGTLKEQEAAGQIHYADGSSSKYQGVDKSGKVVPVTGINDPRLSAHSGVITDPPGIPDNQNTGNSIGDQLARIKAQALGIQARLRAVDAGGSDGVTSSSGNSRNSETELGTRITTASSPAYQSPTNNTSYLDSFDKMYKNLYDSDIASINQSSDSDIADTQDAQKKETGTVSTQVARLGGYLGGSGSGMGVLTNLAVRHRAEIADLESKRQAALQAARDGYAKQSFALAQAKMEEADKYEQEAYQRQQDFFKTSQKLIDQQSISKAVSGGAKSTQEIFDALGGKVSVDDINSYLKGVTPDSGGAFNFTSGDTVKLLGSGLSQKDIAGVLDYVNTNGYNDTLRSSLTPSERTTLDSIFLPKSAGTGVGGALTIAEAKSLGLPTSLIGKSEQQVVTDLNSSKPPAWYQDYVTSGWADPEADVSPDALAKMWQEFRSKILAENIAGNDYSANASKGGGSAGGTPSSDDLFSGS